MSHSKINLIGCVILLALAHVCEGSIVDPGFESSPSTAFVTFGDADPDFAAPGIDSTIEGSETLRLVGNGDPNAAFTIALQDVPVDGTTISVGNLVQLTGILGHTSNDPLAAGNTAFLEVSFVDASDTEFMQSIFQSALLGSTSQTDTYLNAVTTSATVPSNAVSVRVKAIYQQLATNDDGRSGAAFVDNLELVVTVPEPASGLVLATGFLMVFARRRRVQ